MCYVKGNASKMYLCKPLGLRPCGEATSGL